MTRAARLGVAIHYMRYTVGNVLVMIAGFASFPIMTRLLDNRQYGIIGYFDTWLLMLAGVFKLGAQHAIVRFYPHRGGEGALASFGANFVLVPSLLSGGLWVLCIAIYAVVCATVRTEDRAVGWMLLLLLLPQIWSSFANSLMMAEERSELSVRISVIARWLEVGTILGIVYFLERNALGVYVARFLVAAIIMLWLLAWTRRHIPMKVHDVDRRSWTEGLRYGLPLVANEIATALLAFVDRVMLRYMTGDFVPVGVYTIGYGLALNISSMLHGALSIAFTQVAVRQFETEGPAAVVVTKRNTLNILVYVCAALTVGLAYAGRDLLLLMAGPDKADSAPVFALIAINYVLFGLLELCGAGLLLHKRSGTVLSLTLASAALNVALNLFLIPAFGVMGAVYATFISYIALGGAQFMLCPHDLRALPSGRSAALATLLAIVTGAIAYATNLFSVTSHLGRLAAMTLLVVLSFLLPALALDRTLRNLMTGFWHKRRTKS